MALIENELKITKLKDLLASNLTLPPYQRPYKWTVKSTNTLFMDTYEAFKKGINEYRLGSVILHKVDSGEFFIVDGQQRLTTLSILLFCLGNTNHNMLKEKYSTLSNKAIVTNYEVLLKRSNELADDEFKKYEEYLLNNCTMVQIATNDDQEAFQFFDSQNSRGKELAPHDLLKSYHLREMSNEDESQKVKIINSWENIKQETLSDLFQTYLYPLTQWYLNKDGLDYSINKIDTFKGIKGKIIYNFAIYHKSSNLYVEQFNANGSNELLATKYLNQFQLTQPILAGKRFFNFTFHYEQLLDSIRKEIKKQFKHNQIPDKGSGNIYIKQLYECSLLFFADRFGLANLTMYVIQQLYTWCYSLRLTMYAVYQQTVNKYAKGQHVRANQGICMFSAISEMLDPEELRLIILKQPHIENNNKEKYKAVYELLCKWNRWQND